MGTKTDGGSCRDSVGSGGFGGPAKNVVRTVRNAAAIGEEAKGRRWQSQLARRRRAAAGFGHG